MEELIDKLCAYHHPGVFNPWSEYDVSCDISPDAPSAASSCGNIWRPA